ncbi:16S rRNA (guanine(527)-N(7))-methyltransferase RsmG [Caproiciproducens sp. NJN-50]|uniref:16S rRNA (guanine(527)-N(7))-methyltransferase RsmG n=1 Tax=Acutalibacteraceae TaxID=3082771 RepID=UPI000FFE16A9|nr:MULTISPECIES: 16S rRNA (guanine(527)-N(7))-methyltransferase RsmG [Acutalibacteraceae]QAT51169.1 16S rRNA (guanine(527)-N(7))-methyltransferase RsmG [Caproiciproducens sp. NJN-50]
MKQIGEWLISSAAEYGIPVSPVQAEQFQTYLELLAEWNQKMNLTALKEPEEIAEKHFLDSILILKYLKIPQGAKLIDVGTGAGFPGVPLKILRPDLKLTLMDGLNKRLIFLEELLRTLSLKAELVHLRAEEGGRKPEYRERFDLATARAVARLPVLCEYCLPFLKTEGLFAAMKGPEVKAELGSAEKAISLLGCETVSAVEYTLPGGDGRSLVTIRRKTPTPAVYPRHGSKIAKLPL